MHNSRSFAIVAWRGISHRSAVVDLDKCIPGTIVDGTVMLLWLQFSVWHPVRGLPAPLESVLCTLVEMTIPMLYVAHTESHHAASLLTCVIPPLTMCLVYAVLVTSPCIKSWLLTGPGGSSFESCLLQVRHFRSQREEIRCH